MGAVYTDAAIIRLVDGVGYEIAVTAVVVEIVKVKWVPSQDIRLSHSV